MSNTAVSNKCLIQLSHLSGLAPRSFYRWALLFVLLSLVALLTACGDSDPTPAPTPTQEPSATATATIQTVRMAQRTPTPTAEPGQLAARVTPVDPATTLPLFAAQVERVRLALAQPLPILTLTTTLTNSLTAAQLLAQDLAIADPRFQEHLRSQQDGEPLRNEIFGIYAVHADDITAATEACRQVACYRVEMYNYALNLATVAYVDVQNRQVVAVMPTFDMQPDLPPHLVQVAIEIAANAPEVIEALEGKPPLEAAMMAGTKTALNQTRCERSQHLCVAPTFLYEGRALWAIVDLTEGTLVGVRWTDVGEVKQITITEKRLEDEVVSKRYCETVNTLARDRWELEYLITSSDGLRIMNVRFQGQPVLDSAAVVDWHVSYSTRDGFGYSDAIGCPTFSQAAVVAFNGPNVVEIKEGEKLVGFALEQAFRSELWPQPCNYHYKNRYEFYLDGRLRPVMLNLGRGCGNDGWYRPVLRLAFGGDNSFAAWDGGDWRTWANEQWQRPSGAVVSETVVSGTVVSGTVGSETVGSEMVTNQGYPFRVVNAQGQGYYLTPARGQFNDGGRGDDPYIYLTRRHPDRDEGDADLITIGSCCNTDYQQGPEKFIDAPPESVENAPLVVWYVAQMKNDDRPGEEYCWVDAVWEDGVYVPQVYPCAAGPMLTPTDEH